MKTLVFDLHAEPPSDAEIHQAWLHLMRKRLLGVTLQMNFSGAVAMVCLVIAILLLKAGYVAFVPLLGMALIACWFAYYEAWKLDDSPGENEQSLEYVIEGLAERRMYRAAMLDADIGTYFNKVLNQPRLFVEAERALFASKKAVKVALLH